MFCGSLQIKNQTCVMVCCLYAMLRNVFESLCYRVCVGRVLHNAWELWMILQRRYAEIPRISLTVPGSGNTRHNWHNIVAGEVDKIKNRDDPYKGHVCSSVGCLGHITTDPVTGQHEVFDAVVGDGVDITFVCCAERGCQEPMDGLSLHRRFCAVHVQLELRWVKIADLM